MSADRKQKLELTWIGKENRPRLEPRVLLEDTEKSYHAHRRVKDTDLFDNRLINGDNLLSLKALEQEFTGRIKCIFIDPPYNTGSAFEEYDDGIEHSLWLSLLRDRLDILARLLTSDGSLWVTLDDNEAHYMKVLGDEIFGRECFIADITWQKRDGPPNDRKIGSIHDHVLVWGKTKIVTGKKTRRRGIQPHASNRKSRCPVQSLSRAQRPRPPRSLSQDRHNRQRQRRSICGVPLLRHHKSIYEGGGLAPEGNVLAS